MKADVLQPQTHSHPSTYGKALINYMKTQIKLIKPFLNQISKTCQYSSQYPICKILQALSKLFLLNEIQVIFYAYLIRQTHWNINQKIIYTNAQLVQDILSSSIEGPDYKRIILYLMINAYTVKYYLNQDNFSGFEEVQNKCQNFKKVFENWNKKHSSITTKINPRTLNIVYRNLFENMRKENPDFNHTVDLILQISPNSHSEKGKQEKRKTALKGQRNKSKTKKIKQKEYSQYDEDLFIYHSLRKLDGQDRQSENCLSEDKK